MFSRREFVYTAAGIGAGLALAPVIPNFAFAQTARYRLPQNYGMGGAPLGNGAVAIDDKQAVATVEAAWNAGVRFFDTSPFYGYGLSEHRFGEFLNEKTRKEYILSTKVGRVFKAGKKVAKSLNWVNPAPFEYTYDYSAAGTRRSIEDSLLRMGIESIDIVFVHDLNEGNQDLGKKWKEHFQVAKNGAFKELAKMKKEGLIKAWGLGVNEAEPILQALDVAEPDIMLAATQYSLIKHDEALNKTFPTCQKRGVSVVIGAPLNNGFLSGADRYDYSGTFPEGAKEKRAALQATAKKHNVDLRTAALQFCAAHPVVTAVIPGARHPKQSTENQVSMTKKIPAAFWAELKIQKLIAENAPTPA